MQSYLSSPLRSDFSSVHPSFSGFLSCWSAGRVCRPAESIFLCSSAGLLRHFAVSLGGFLTKEAQYLGIDLLCVSPNDAVWPAGWPPAQTRMARLAPDAGIAGGKRLAIPVAVDDGCRLVVASHAGSVRNIADVARGMRPGSRWPAVRALCHLRTVAARKMRKSLTCY